jgi:peroxiredoxin
VFGSSNPYSEPGDTQITLTTRNLRSTDHYNGTVEQLQRQTQQTYVINMQHAVDLTINRTITARFSASVGIPFVSASWGIPSPTAPTPGPRATEDARGLGDISVGGRMWVLPTSRFKSGNISVGLGVKMPTGNEGYRDSYPDRNGNNNELRYVDQSVQPGDGGWGLLFELAGFRRIPHAQLFASANYLANPRDKNETTSGSINRLPPNTPPAGNPDRFYNSVPDQFLVRAGGAVPIGNTGFAGSVAWRIEGLPRYDLIGASHGFRRPGVEMFVEPGISYARGNQGFSFQMPIGYYRNRFPDPYTGAPGDATFPNYIFLASYGYRFGAKPKIATQTAASSPGAQHAPSGPDLAPPASSAASPDSSIATPSSYQAPGTSHLAMDVCDPMGRSARLNLTLKDLDGNSVNLADFKGKIIVLNFWATWCAPCKIEIPGFVELQARYQSDGLQFIGLSTDDTPDKLKVYAADQKMNYPVLQGRGHGEILDKFSKVETLPTTILIRRDGSICKTHSGAVTKEALETEIKALLK